ncbi:MAG: alcohol dehydrogenase catalytic domain-containing protein, partial [Leptospiraceae bacterium]|nr:alcohol dehydrogenase catalytic domain-containing protein [Leptospiraceae bacterium]
YCGVCSTDLARRFLPYPLPQIIGHEVVARHHGRPVVIEINASHAARGLTDIQCAFCNNDMNTQCPHRITLGIDRLPGGFAPYILAPINAIVPIPENVSELAAALTEPFAAALQGVEATAPREQDRVAVLGPRRLGSLIIAALAGYRNREQADFEIAAIARHDHLLKLCRELGADTLINTNKQDAAALKASFDIVFDTTGKPEGFELALSLTRRVLHLKSTNGQEVMGLKHLTDMVVDEIALLPFSTEHLGYSWPREIESGQHRRNRNVLVHPEVSADIIEQIETHGDYTVWRLDPREAGEKIRQALDADTTFPEGSPFPRFDLAVAATLQGVDEIVRPFPGEEFSPLRARGAVLLAPDISANPAKGAADLPELVRQITERKIEIHTSRCGSFERALQILSHNPEMTRVLEQNLITHQFGLSDIDAAFATAADSSQSVKVIVATGATDRSNR